MQPNPLLSAFLAVCLSLSSAAQEGIPSAKKVDSLIRSKRWSQAEEALEKVTASDRALGSDWQKLANVRHQQKDWEGAIEAGWKAERYPHLRATALYNIACAQSLDSQLDAAAESLLACREAGFLDFDLMSTDSDLKPLGERREAIMPKRYPFTKMVARNKVEMNYALLKPAGYDASKTYPVLVALAPGGVRSADWMMDELWSEVDQQKEWLVLCIAAPAKKGWWTHPTHHALEDILKLVQKEVKVEGKRFHLFGFGNGCGPALTYSGMSKKYFQSMSVMACTGWQADDGASWSRYADLPVLQWIGSESDLLPFIKSAHTKLKHAGCESTLRVVEGDADMLLSQRGEALFGAITKAHLKNSR